MVLIDLSTGSKRRTSQKTEPSRERSGSPLRSTLATGAITAKKVSVFSFTKTRTNTKACGLLTSATARVLTGKTKVTNCVVNIRATGTRIKSTAEEPFSIKMGIVTTATGWMACHREKVAWSTQTRTSTKASGMKESAMVTVFWQSVTAITLKVTGFVTSAKVRAVTSTTQRTSYLLASGSRTSQRLVSTPKSTTKMPKKWTKSLTSKTHTNFQVFQSWAWLTQLDYSKRQWRKQSRTEPTSECSTSPSKRCSLLKSWWTWRQHSRLCLMARPSSTKSLWRLCSPTCRFSQQTSSCKSCLRLAVNVTKKNSYPSNCSHVQWHFCWRRTRTRFRPALSKRQRVTKKHTTGMRLTSRWWRQRKCRWNRSRHMLRPTDNRWKAKTPWKTQTTMSTTQIK